MARSVLVSATLSATAVPAYADAPLNYLTGHGVRAHPVTALTWGLLALSVAVVVIMTALVVLGIARRSGRIAPVASGRFPVERPAGGINWIVVGIVATVAALLGSLIWTMAVLARVAAPPEKPGLVLELTGHQWWWQVRYTDEQPSRVFTTANEIHIPVDTPVRIRLRSDDVIHSFWVPALGGKMDLIPGQTNETWIQADTAGSYAGQCAEYCGVQHAHMAFSVVAQSADEFRRWWDHELEAPRPPTDGAVAAGQRLFQTRCGACHAVRGTTAGGIYGPDLSHLMIRGALAAGTLPNTPGHLAAWLADPQGPKPGNQMPALALPGPELEAIRAYLQTLD
ncbi:MAG: cytochrome c oxidase subunit II [Gemmatimonas sp.]